MAKGLSSAGYLRTEALRQQVRSGGAPQAATTPLASPRTAALRQQVSTSRGGGSLAGGVSPDLKSMFDNIAQGYAHSQNQQLAQKAKGVVAKFDQGGLASSIVHGAETALDVPRRAVEAVQEGIGNTIKLATGQQTHFSHVGDVIAGKRSFANTLQDLGVHNKTALLAGGIAGDIASDPLTFLQPEAATAHASQVASAFHDAADALRAGDEARLAEVAGRAAKNADTVAASVAAAKKLGPDALDRAGETVQRTQTAASLDKNTLAAIGGHGGLSLGKNGPTVIPHEVRQAVAGITSPIRTTVGDALDKLGSLAPEQAGNPNVFGGLRGGDAALKAASRSGIEGTATNAFKALRSISTEGARATGEADNLRIAAQNLFKDTTPAEQDQIIHLAESPTARAAADPNMAAKVEQLRGIYAQAHQAASDAGLNIGHQSDYFPRQFTDETKKLIQSGTKRPSIGQVADSMLKNRTLDAGGTWLGEKIPEGLDQAGVRRAVNDITQRQLGQSAYRVDAANLTDTYLKGLYNKIGDARSNQRLVGEGVFKDTAPLTVDKSQGILSSPKNVKFFNDNINGELMRQLESDPSLATDPEFAHVLDKQLALNAPQEQTRFGQRWDQFVNYLKRWQIATPGFLTRNTLGQFWFNDLGGVSMSSYPEFFGADRAFSKANGVEGDIWQRFAAENPKQAQDYLQARSVMLSSPGQYGGEITGPEARNPILRGAHKAGVTSENLGRGTMAYDVLKKGGTLDDAVAAVDKYHFHFGKNLSTTEKNVRKVIPFYTFMRYNAPLELESLVKHPSTFAKFEHVTNNLAQQNQADSVVPSYFGELGAVPTGVNFGGGQVYATPNTPGTETFNLLSQSPVQTLAGSVTPLVKTPVELIRGKQFYKDIPFTAARHPLPSGLGDVLGPPLSALGLAQKDASGGYSTSDKVAYTIDQFAPVLARIRRQVPNEKRYQDRAVTSWINFFLGNQLRTNTAAEQADELKRRSSAKFFNSHKAIPVYVSNKSYAKYQAKKAKRAAGG